MASAFRRCAWTATTISPFTQWRSGRSSGRAAILGPPWLNTLPIARLRIRPPTTLPPIVRKRSQRRGRSVIQSSVSNTISSSSSSGPKSDMLRLPPKLRPRSSPPKKRLRASERCTPDSRHRRVTCSSMFTRRCRRISGASGNKRGSEAMARMTMIEAIRDAHDVMMGRDENVVVFGEDVGYFGGVFRCTKGLQQKYGRARCFDTPISESGIVGAAIGMAAYGLRPCVEIQFADYMYPAYDQLVSEAARLRYRSAGDFTAPITVRMPTGGGIFGAQTHSQSPEALFTHVCGLKTVVPSNPHDAKGLLIAAIEDDNPVIFLEPKRLYNGPFDGHHERPIVPWATHPLSE